MLKRTHTCGALNATKAGETVILNGWVDVRRDHGGLIFIDLRDRYGITQVVFEPDAGEPLMEAARELRVELFEVVELLAGLLELGVLSGELAGRALA